MTLWIPAWLLWTVGAVAGLVLLVLAVAGVLFIVQMREFSRVMGRHFGW